MATLGGGGKALGGGETESGTVLTVVVVVPQPAEARAAGQQVSGGSGGACESRAQHLLRTGGRTPAWRGSRRRAGPVGGQAVQPGSKACCRCCAEASTDPLTAHGALAQRVAVGGAVAVAPGAGVRVVCKAAHAAQLRRPVAEYSPRPAVHPAALSAWARASQHPPPRAVSRTVSCPRQAAPCHRRWSRAATRAGSRSTITIPIPVPTTTGTITTSSTPAARSPMRAQEPAVNSS